MCKENSSEPPKAPERWVSLLGFVIVAKADLLAATAFLLSAITLVYQLSIWLRGPDPSLYSPQTVYIFFDRYSNNRTVTRVASQVSLVNSAPIGKDVVVRDVEVKVSVRPKGSKETQEITKQKWLNFVTFKRDNNRFVPDPKEAAHPFPVAGGGASSHSVSFAPTEDDCPPTSPNSSVCPNSDRYFITDTDFLKKIDGNESVVFQLSANLVGRSTALVATCTVAIGTALLLYLSENNWFAARCVPDKT